MKTASLPELSAPAQGTTNEAPVSAKNTLVVGLDWGTNMSSLMASP